MKMDRLQLTQEIARVCGLPKAEAKDILEAALGTMVSALQQGERIEIRGFGVFVVRDRRPRQWRNPASGQIERSAPKKAVRFRASTELLKWVNNSAPHPNGDDRRSRPPS
jgi:nucleoid DNA-binding protein